MTVTIFEIMERRGTVVVHQGKNLRVILDHARRFRVGGTSIWQDGCYLRVSFPDGAYCTTAFADQTALRDWIADRVKYGRGRFIAGAPA